MVERKLRVGSSEPVESWWDAVSSVAWKGVITRKKP